MRVQITFSGTVQGVGFRYKAYQLARRHSLNGFVKNLPDGSVLLEVEGSKEAIDGIFCDLSQAMYGYIESTEYNRMESDCAYLGFDIRY